MSTGKSPHGPGRVLRAVAVPAAVLLAGAGCITTAIALNSVPMPTVQVVVGERTSEQAEDGAEEPEESGGPQETEEPSPPEAEPEPAPPPQAPEPTVSAPPESYNGSSTVFGDFLVTVETGYTDPTVTDGMGSYATAPAGMEYHVYRLNVTNQGAGPSIFDTYGTTGTAVDGRTFAHDPDAEYTVAWDYFWDEVNPGETVTTHILFLAPVGTEFSRIMVGGVSPLEPA
ncbi:DUF4352 domain-containing protein [Nocardiopsis algeriensis]|uniref:DUF4352 domain-containing protein n=1 Tax=Nocardiopsis algeriensis TaxID=1478215 RepID=A0A841II06_9ACTN|nr:DUF4352 domain-containing protein [Nocardiopsis algeriensis]MBB6118283.1 hypothetical protein [Nocardiopsis algeriensis]